MTRLQIPAVSAVAQRVASLLTGALLLFGLAACETMGSGGGDLNAGLTARPKPAIAFAPVQGVPAKYAAKMNEQLAEAAKAKGIQVVDANAAEYIVKGAYIALPEARKGTKISYALDVTDKAGKRIHRLEGEELVSERRGGDSWSHVNDEAIQKVADKSATELNGWMENPNPPAAPAVAQAQQSDPATTASVSDGATRNGGSLAASVPASTPPAQPRVTQTAAAPAEIVAVVAPVAGAPGDGQTSLSDAMRRHLARQGVKVASGATAGAYQIRGSVEMGAAEDGEQPITIRWVVADPGGKELQDAVVQRNKVAAGSLDGAWGPVADAAASEAAKAVAKLIAKPGGQAS